MAQLVADYFQIPIEDVNVACANSSQLGKTACTAGSRAVSVGSMSIFKSAEKIKEKLKDIASHTFEARKEDLIYADGKIFVTGLPDNAISLNELAQIAYKPNKLPDNIEPGLSAYSSYSPENHTYPFGTHIAIVEVDIITGKTNILEYLAVDDIGNVINPMIVEGQVHGGVIQGISQALLEEIIYDDEGQLLSSSLMDYLIPTAYESPNINSTRTVTPSPSNIFGVKGVGEVGTIAATPAIMNAVEDALSPFNLEIDKMPAKPDYILNLLNSSKPK
jgi:carbon-monoxide dehydrogenase large subunit|tara:strand:- start:80 stop:907 length:828 start_codon:yes stop_codon:yes gene_type:complete